MPTCVVHISESSEVPVGTRALLVTPLLLVALAASVHADPLFLAPFLSFDAGFTPTSMAIADLNADGRPDLAVANAYSNTVSVLLGNGDGTFGTKTDFGTGSEPVSVAIADLNADGRLDLAVANVDSYSYYSGTVSVLLGNGDGTFGAKTDFGTGSYPYSVAIADLNGDGRPDLAVTNLGSFTVSVLLGNGDGTFGAKTDFGTGSGPRSVAIADLNADGRPDLAVANAYSNTVSVLLGTGDGTFGTMTDFGTGSFPNSVAIADLNADGRPDLALSNADPDSYSSTVSVLLGNGDGTFGDKAHFGAGRGPESVAIADLNADGRPDLAVANGGSSTVSVLLGNGDGTFGARTDFGTGNGPLSVAIADLNADGRPDLAVANGGSNTVSVLLGNGDGTFGTTTDFGTGSEPVSVAIADLNADGRPDLAVANSGSHTVSVLLGNADGTFGTTTDFGTGSTPISVANADLNADGRPDLALSNADPGSYSSTVSVLLGNGDGTFGARTDFGTGNNPRSVAIADLNADGRPDLAVANTNPDSYSPTVSVLLGNGDGTFGTKTDFGTGSGFLPSSVAIADLNADGRPDLAVAIAGSNTVSVLLGNGDGTFGAKTDFGTGNIPFSVAIADLNADGKPDLAVANAGSNTVSVLLNRGGTPAPVAMAFDFTPNTLNLTSRGLWVTGFLEPASPFAASDIDIASIRLNGTVPVDPAAPTALGDHDANGVPDLMVKFNRVAVELSVSEGNSVPVTVTGTVDGRSFIGTDYIRVHRAVVSAPLAGSHLMAGSVTPVRWQTPSGVTVESVALLHSLDGGSTWSLIARGQPNTGSYDWTVPNVQTDQAKVAVVLVESADETGDNVDGVLGVSEAFSIEAVVGVGDRGPAQFALAIRGATPNPTAGGRLWVEFALRDGSSARLELMDVAGRVLTSKQVGTLGPGTHALDLSEGGALRPGIYFLRLTQGGSEVRARAAVLR
jgi:predicted NUDIX family NTP pyrophosphohydrolase